MGWAVGDHDGRDIGYGVPAKCDHPDCDTGIDRGLGYVCGGDVYGGEHGCGLFFCDSHLGFLTTDDGQLIGPQRCDRCLDEEPPFDPKPDVPKWINHKLADPSWQQWRDEHPQWVANPT